MGLVLSFELWRKTEEHKAYNTKEKKERKEKWMTRLCSTTEGDNNVQRYLVL